MNNWGIFVLEFHKREGFYPHPRDSRAKMLFEYFNAGAAQKATRASRLTTVMRGLRDKLDQALHRLAGAERWNKEYQRRILKWQDFAVPLRIEARELRARVSGFPSLRRCETCNVMVSEWVESDTYNGRICRPCESLNITREKLIAATEAEQNIRAEANRLRSENAALKKKLLPSEC